MEVHLLRRLSGPFGATRGRYSREWAGRFILISPRGLLQVHDAHRTFQFLLSQMMEVEPLSAGESRRSSRSHGTLLVTLRLPPRSLQLALTPDISLPISTLTVDAKSATGVAASPFPLASSPPTIASSPAPTGPLPPKKRGGKRKAVGPGAGVFSLAQTVPENGGGSGAGTPAPATEKEKVKSGPKANPGGINAQLRALDRTGRPTRKWTKVPFPVQTCSGYTFYSTTWVTPQTGIDPTWSFFPLLFFMRLLPLVWMLRVL